jgi:hypothetical protein
VRLIKKIEIAGALHPKIQSRVEDAYTNLKFAQNWKYSYTKNDGKIASLQDLLRMQLEIIGHYLNKNMSVNGLKKFVRMVIGKTLYSIEHHRGHPDYRQKLLPKAKNFFVILKTNLRKLLKIKSDWVRTGLENMDYLKVIRDQMSQELAEIRQKFAAKLPREKSMKKMSKIKNELVKEIHLLLEKATTESFKKKAMLLAQELENVFNWKFVITKHKLSKSDVKDWFSLKQREMRRVPQDQARVFVQTFSSLMIKIAKSSDKKIRIFVGKSIKEFENSLGSKIAKKVTVKKPENWFVQKINLVKRIGLRILDHAGPATKKKIVLGLKGKIDGILKSQQAVNAGADRDAGLLGYGKKIREFLENYQSGTKMNGYDKLKQHVPLPKLKITTPV